MSTLLKAFSVTGLFGDRNLKVEFPTSDQVSFIHGPNGVGKSTFLRLIDGVFNPRSGTLRATRFDKLEVILGDGTRVEVHQVRDGGSKLERARRRAEQHRRAAHRESSLDDDFDGVGLQYFVNGEPSEPDDEEEEILSGISVAELNSLRRNLDDLVPSLVRVGPNVWSDRSSGERLSIGEAISRYSNVLPLSQRTHAGMSKTPLSRALGSISVELVGADRLRDRTVPRSDEGRPGHRARPESTVDTQRRELAMRMSGELARFARSSQKLDQSFPLRLLAALDKKPPAPKPAEVASQVEGVVALRKRLESVGLLELDRKVLTPTRAAEADATQRRMIKLYLEDDRKKLSELQEFAARLELFQRLINSKFDRKQIEFHRTTGYRVVTSSQEVLGADQLSSGEQHELVLLYRLIFSSRPKTLFLIDEPELSLHVAWQASIADDLEEIAQLGDSQFVLATHSPGVINDKWQLLLPLEAQILE